MYVRQVYRTWNEAKHGTSTESIADSKLMPNDIWSLFPTHWLTDKVS